MRFLFFIIILYPLNLISQVNSLEKFLFRDFKYEGNILPYRILEPKESNKKKFPLIIFLHGSGERGDNNISQLTHGGDFFFRKNSKKKI